MATTVEQMSDWNRYPTYAVYLQMMQNYVANHPTLCKMDTVGYSVNGRPIITMIISDNVGVDEDEPEFWWSSTMHGDETTGWYFMIRLVDELLTNYGTDAQITNLVNNVEIYISPLTNPDGTFYGSSNGTSMTGARRANANGTDLNRSFPDLNGYAGTSDPEVTMMKNYADAHNFVMSANGHGGTECLNYPWDEQNWYSSNHPHPDTDWWEYICHQYANTCHAINSNYLKGPGTMYDNTNNSTGITEGCDWYYTQGGRQDYMNYYHHCREITMEWSNTKKLDSEYLNTYWGYNRQALLDYTEQVLYGFRGIVTDACTNEPLSGVKVFINNHDADNSEVYTSAPIGNYHRPIYAGTYSVTFSKEGYVSKTLNVTTQNMACQRLDVSLCPEPTFTANPVAVFEGSSIQFTNTTEGCNTMSSWTFEGGSPATSTAANPTVTYNTHGTYNVTLTIENPNGCTSSTTGHITIYEGIAPTADFSASETIVPFGSSVTFTDLSTNMPTSWSWTFNGGTPATSTVQNPRVTYNTPGT
ncbi:MAG: PKD domain-containing protein, partial [Bacteroidales bacterium]|nr:PKD domain-containing protein [Bacteroidales bacterium]